MNYFLIFSVLVLSAPQSFGASPCWKFAQAVEPVGARNWIAKFFGRPYGNIEAVNALLESKHPKLVGAKFPMPLKIVLDPSMQTQQSQSAWIVEIPDGKQSRVFLTETLHKLIKVAFEQVIGVEDLNTLRLTWQFSGLLANAKSHAANRVEYLVSQKEQGQTAPGNVANLEIGPVEGSSLSATVFVSFVGVNEQGRERWAVEFKDNNRADISGYVAKMSQNVFGAQPIPKHRNVFHLNVPSGILQDEILDIIRRISGVFSYGEGPDAPTNPDTVRRFWQKDVPDYLNQRITTLALKTLYLAAIEDRIGTQAPKGTGGLSQQIIAKLDQIPRLNDFEDLLALVEAMPGTISAKTFIKRILEDFRFQNQNVIEDPASGDRPQFFVSDRTELASIRTVEGAVVNVNANVRYLARLEMDGTISLVPYGEMRSVLSEYDPNNRRSIFGIGEFLIRSDPQWTRTHVTVDVHQDLKNSRDLSVPQAQIDAIAEAVETELQPMRQPGRR